MNKPLLCAALSSLALLSTNALADDDANANPDAATQLKVTSDWDRTELIKHLGTSYGSGYVGGRAATITTFHLEKLCRLPCTTTVATDGSYYVDAPGMPARGFEIPVGTKRWSSGVRLDAHAAPPSKIRLTPTGMVF